ncbi:MAG TPA: DUF456 domain-containing protein [Bacteroidetes bacterium]|nr:DUF456 domain-containing protein [Bacteroidota bacterium]
MDILILILAFVLLGAGILGSFLPVLPGPPLAFVGILLIHFFTEWQFTESFLWMSGIAMILITIADYGLPGILVRYGKGSKYAVNGANIGVVAGLFTGPMGLILGPFVGALLGEMYSGKSAGAALRPAFFAFLGFLSGVFLKLAFCFYLQFKLIFLLF